MAEGRRRGRGRGSERGEQNELINISKNSIFAKRSVNTNQNNTETMITTATTKAKTTTNKQIKDHIFLEFTKSICPDCREMIDAHVLTKDEKVYMKKRCNKHGLFESLISSDVERYVTSYKFNRQGLMPSRFGTEVKEGCPYDCGLCPDHEQHSCVGVIEITNACNLRCPTCFATAEGHGFLSLKDVNYMLDELIKQEGAPVEVVQFSGGEPTIHPQILDIVSLAKKKRSIKHVMINTNGIRISVDESFVSDLASLNPVIYLQFDGFRKETYEKIRGKDLKEAKMKAIENMEKYGMKIVLVCTVQRNVNEDELGNLVDFALSRKSIKGIVFQPTFYSGRHPDVDPLDVVTLPEVIKLISEESEHGLQNSDFVPTPCCYPTCNSSCYIYVDEKKVKPLARIVNVEEYLEYFMNKSVADLDQIKEALQVLTSFECCSGGRDDQYGAKAPTSTESNNNTCCSIPIELKGIEENVKVIMVQSFMDPFNFDIKRLIKCCIHEITPQGKIVPICAFNNIPKYREEVDKYYLDKRKLDTHTPILEG